MQYIWKCRQSRRQQIKVNEKKWIDQNQTDLHSSGLLHYTALCLVASLLADVSGYGQWSILWLATVIPKIFHVQLLVK